MTLFDIAKTAVNLYPTVREDKEVIERLIFATNAGDGKSVTHHTVEENTLTKNMTESIKET